MSVNKVILVGRLGRDPDVHDTDSGKAVANLSLATEESWRDAGGERQKKTTWHRVVAWGKLADVAQRYLRKGSLVFIEGKIDVHNWQDKEGQKRTSFEIVAASLRMLEGREGAAAAAAGATGGRASAADPGPEIPDEDIPEDF